jgi:hypothetical protein
MPVGDRGRAARTTSAGRDFWSAALGWNVIPAAIGNMAGETLFGATGDLARNKLFPALYVARRDQLDLPVFGVALLEWPPEADHVVGGDHRHTPDGTAWDAHPVEPAAHPVQAKRLRMTTDAPFEGTSAVPNRRARSGRGRPGSKLAPASTVAITFVISSVARSAPRQRRVPPPKGTHSLGRGRWITNRSGRNASGSG